VLDRFATLVRPVIWLLSLSTNALVRLLGGDPDATSEQLSEEELVAATASLAVAALLTWGLVALVGASVPWAAVVLLPYAAWLAVATALSVQYARLNPRAAPPYIGGHERRADDA
jgi:fatty acid desaturase